MPLDVTISDREKVKVTLMPDGPVHGEPQWSVISGNSTLMVDPGGISAYLVSEDNVPGPGPSDTVYEVSADVDMGAGTVMLSDQITLHVGEAQATSLGLTLASPEPK